MSDAKAPTAHADSFVRDRLPPPDLWPRLDWSGAPDLVYPDRLNAAFELLDRWAEQHRSHGEHGRHGTEVGLGVHDVTTGDRICLHHTAGPWTYRRLYETANRIARVLVEDCGVVPGTRVLLRGGNHPMLVACWFAVLKTGGIAVTTMPLLRVRELTEIIDRAGVRLALTEASVAADLEAALAVHADARVIRFNTDGPASLDSMMASRPPRFATVLTGADDPAIIAFTSGTTGRSKGTVHFHRDLLAVADTYGRHVLQPDPDDIFIGSPPLAFTYALGGLVLFPMRVSASTALIDPASPPHLLEGIQRYKATITITSPTAYRAMLKQAGSFDLSSLRKCVSAGETLPAATFDAWRDAVGIRIMDGIGSTELLHMFIGCTADDAKPGATGRVVPGYQAIVVDEQGHEVPTGTIGRLAVAGPTGCRYLDDLENQRKYVQQGWNLTGDAYRVDENGYFWYQSRTDDMIISSGYNISGPEIENVLLAHAAVSECAVVGVADDARGQLVKAFVVPAADATPSDALVKTLQDFVKSELAPYKYPRAIEFVTALPRTLTGKVQRFRLRESATGAAGTRGGARGDRKEDTGVQFHEPEGWARPAGYANAVSAVGRTVFVAGQVGWDPATASVTTDDFVEQVRQALANVVSALAAAGATPNQLTRLTWFVTDREAYLANRAAIGAHYRAIIGRHFPAMSVVVVRDLVEAGAQVEIEATAVVPE